MHYVYVLKSGKDHKLYIGRSDNLRERLSDHARGHVEATRHRRPLVLVYYEAYQSEIDAKEREQHLKKSGSSSMGLKKRIKRSITG